MGTNSYWFTQSVFFGKYLKLNLTYQVLKMPPTAIMYYVVYNTKFLLFLADRKEIK